MNITNLSCGLCTECVGQSMNLDNLQLCPNCVVCEKTPQILFNRIPYCSSCYIQSVLCPLKLQKSQLSSQANKKSKLIGLSTQRSQIKVIKKTSNIGYQGQLVKKIYRLFDDCFIDEELIKYLGKKSIQLDHAEWTKIVSKVNKNNNVVYIMIGNTVILGAFHTQSVNIEGEASLLDEQSGIFWTGRQKFQLQFIRIKSNTITYSCKQKRIKFGNPSSLQIIFGQGIKIVNQIVGEFQCKSCFLYRV